MFLLEDKSKCSKTLVDETMDKFVYSKNNFGQNWSNARFKFGIFLCIKSSIKRISLIRVSSSHLHLPWSVQLDMTNIIIWDHSVVDRCIDTEISLDINWCVATLSDLFTRQFVDLIAIDIPNGNERFSPILHRYQIGFRSIDDPSWKAIDHADRINSSDRTYRAFFKELMKKIGLLTGIHQSVVMSDF